MSENEALINETIEYSIHSGGTINVEFRDGTMRVIADTHPNFETISKRLQETRGEVSDKEIKELIDFGFIIGSRLERLSERVAFNGNAIFFDGDIIHSTLSDHVLRMAQESNPQLGALVKFMENIAENPSEEAKNSLYDWIVALQKQGESLTITRDGMVIAYKGVKIDADGVSVSRHAGPGIIDGVSMNGHLPNRVGSVIEIPRSYVDADSSVDCSTGLHVGTFNYAHRFARGRTLEVEFNPRDVVSVPSHKEFQKVRITRYVVLKETEAPETIPVYKNDVEWSDDDYDLWNDAGYSDSQAEYYINYGYTVEEALEAASEEEGYDDDYEADSEEEAPVAEDDTQEWEDAGFDKEDIEYYRDSLLYTLEQAKEARAEDEVAPPADPEVAEESVEEETAKEETASADETGEKKSKKKKNKKKSKKDSQ